MTSRRKLMVDTLRDLLKAEHNGRYFVHRGPIAWSSFDFKAHPFAVGISLDSGTLRRADTRLIGNRSRVSLEMFTSMSADGKLQLDDGILDEFIADAESVLDKLEVSQDANEYSVAIGVDRENASFQESSDSTLKVQGVVVSFSITY